MKCNENANALYKLYGAVMKKICLCLFLLPLLNGCISFKSEYPETSYYRLSQEPIKINNSGGIAGTLQIRNFSSSDQLNTEHIMAILDEERVQNYYYHRWVSAPAELVTDFIIERINNAKLFNGVVKSNSLIIPDYILEGHIIDMIAHNTKERKPDTNYVIISYQISLIRKEPLKTERNVLLNKLYTISIPRKNNEVTSVAPAFSHGMSELSDKMINDIIEVVKNSGNK